jgi:uncharacterized membrane protein/uncharacterized protein YfaP (DUF2135 family)
MAKFGHLVKDEVNELNQHKAALLVLLMLASMMSTHLSGPNQSTSVELQSDFEMVEFAVSADTFNDFIGQEEKNNLLESRDLSASSTIGIFNANGFFPSRPIAADWLTPKDFSLVVIIDDDVYMKDARNSIDAFYGIEVREFIAPSGLLVQGTHTALLELVHQPFIHSYSSAPLALFLDDSLLDATLFTGGEEYISELALRVESWRYDGGISDGVEINDGVGGTVMQSFESITNHLVDIEHRWDIGRVDGYIDANNLKTLANQPAIRSISLVPEYHIFNDNSRSHMSVNTMKTYFNTNLDGSNQIIAVADAGLDEDHGDFGTRIIGSYDVIGDGSTADMHSGHGTHVSCTVLGDGFRGGYAGVAPEAELYFQAMENDNTGNFQSPSLNSLLDSSYNAGARIHTNSWGSSQASQQGKYNSDTEDVDDNTNYYDRYYTGREGLTVLFANGNDGPGSGTISPPATAKNAISVGSHINRGQASPNTIADSSSRGPTEDNRIKPDVLAPGGFVRSCLAQEATDTAGGTTQPGGWYIQYSGTSMATPNAAGVASMIREYIIEIAQRPSPQGALVKALMVLGAQDIGAKNIPNNDEGWGRINVRNSLAPSNGQGIWVDDRSVMSGTGNSKSYSFNISQANAELKVVLAWSDERGSRFSSTQLVNNLDLEVTSPDGQTTYYGNDFSGGKSVNTGTRDSINNLEVVLIENAVQGVWTVKVVDTYHGGSKIQPYAVAVRGHGVNDLRPDITVITGDFAMSTEIPQVGEDVVVLVPFFNLGNVKADTFNVEFQENGVEVDTKSFDLGPGATKVIQWDWIPTSAGATTLRFIIDPLDELEEINEDNNEFDFIVNVTTPGVKLESLNQEILITSSNQSTTTWEIALTNTALLETNASIETGTVHFVDSTIDLGWYVGTGLSNFSLSGQESVTLNVTLVHPSPPSPGLYIVELLGIDVDNGVTYPYEVHLRVPEIAKARLEFDYQIVPVHPIDETNITVRMYNDGNAPIGYDLFLEAPAGWIAGFSDLGSEAGAISGSTGLIDTNSYREVSLTFTPPQIMTAAQAERTVVLTAISQTEHQKYVEFEIPIRVTAIRDIQVQLETSLGTIRPDSSITMMLSIENSGNQDLYLLPSLELPSGWTSQTTLEPFTLEWQETKNILFSLKANTNAKSGQIQLNLDNGSTRFMWNQNVNVEALPQPTVDFVSLEYSGETYETLSGAGAQPSGVELVYTWILSNTGETIWYPSTLLNLDQNLVGDCDQVGEIALNDIVPVKCRILIRNDAEPMSQPSFTVTFSDENASVVRTAGLVVAPVESYSWTLKSKPEFTTGVEGAIVLELENTGNVALQRRITVENVEDWDISVDGTDILNLEPGQDVVVRLNVISHKPSTREVTFELSESDADSRIFRIDVASFGEPVGSGDDGLSSSVIVTGISLLIFGLLAAAGALVLKQRRQPNPKLPLPPLGATSPVPQTMMAPPVQQTQPAAVVATPTPVAQPAKPLVVCWLCRDGIEGPSLACGTCGARYHNKDSCKPEESATCENCDNACSNFLPVMS